MSVRPLLVIATVLGVMLGLSTFDVAICHADDERPMSLSDVRDQGVHYLKRKRFKQAQVFLDRAFRMNGGPADFLTVYSRGRVAYEQLLIERAMEMVEVAARLTMKDARRERAVKDLAAEIKSRYGRLNLEPAPGETNKEGRIFFESKTGILNKDKRKRFESIRERFRSTDISLPVHVFLPYGEYTANDVEFALVEGEAPPSVDIFLQVHVERASAETRGAAKTSHTWLYVGLGVGAAIAAGMGGYFLFTDETPTTVEVHPFHVQNLHRGQ